MRSNMPDRREALALLAAPMLLAGCKPRAALVALADAGGVGARRAVFVATSRQASGPADYGARRSGTLGYARYQISVPPGHRPGRVELPGRSGPDPARHFVAVENHRFSGAAEFRAQLGPALADRRGEAVVYVHGFNNTFADGVFRVAQLAHDLDVPAVAVHYSWPSAAQPLNYAYDRDSTLFARDGLERLLVDLRAAGARRVTLVAHSMGALLALETLRQIEIGGRGRARALVQGVVLFAPDIVIELFNAQARRIGTLPEPFVIFTSRRDAALRLSARLTGQDGTRLGNLEDYGAVSGLRVLLLDVSAFGDGSALNHFAAASPALIRLLESVGAVDAALGRDRAGRPGLFPGTVLTLQQATAIILFPLYALGG